MHLFFLSNHLSLPCNLLLQSMSINGLRGKLKQLGFYIPVTFYFVVFVVVATLAYKILKGNLNDNGTAFVDIFLLLLKVAVWFGAIVISLSFVSVLISYLFFLWKERKGVEFRIATALHNAELHKKQPVKIFIRPVLKPFCGFIKLRLQYDDVHFSHKFSLIEINTKKFFSTTIEGTYHWDLPEIKEYQIHKAVLYFEDVFQFFSIAVDLPASNNFFTQPTAKNIEDLRVLPRKTEETTTRIEELRRVEGEYLNYKNFENNDDVRRIVWKIYAKNKELVVRIPEIMDPYASHVYLYTSFFTQFNVEGSGPIEIPFLNYLKVMAWTIYQSLVKRGFEVRYIADQDIAKGNKVDEQQWVKYSISTSKWHTEKDLRSYVKTNDASIVVISSLTPPEQVHELVEKHGNDIKFIFIKLTDSLKNQNLIDWVQWLFVQNQKNDLESHKRAWSFSSLRPKVLQNERRLEEIMEKYELEVVR